MARHTTPGSYAQTTDSATNGCLRNPACYTTSPGEEAIIPWVSRTVSAARTTSTMAMMLADADVKLIESRLTQCAREANEKVNREDEELQGQEPTRGSRPTRRIPIRDSGDGSTPSRWRNGCGSG